MAMRKRHRYSMHHQWLAGNRIGELKPCFIQEVTPGDTWKGHTTGVFRLAPLDVPTYMSLNVFVHFFFVPHRLVFPEFEDVITGADTTTPWPTITYNLSDLIAWLDFGVSGFTTQTPDLNAIPVRALNKIWNDHFRNHLTTSEVAQDYLGVHRVNFPSSDYFGGITTEIQQDVSETVDSSGATIPYTEIRDAGNRQRMKERRSQYGERYTDLIYSDYGIVAPDSRLDRAEHCARGKTTIGISEVVATATSAGEETGEYRGHGIAGIRINFPKKHFTEHGTLMGVMYARPRLQLKNRVDRIFTTADKEDLYHPHLANDTQVVVGSNEIYNDSVAETNFGYLPRDEWLRKARDTIAGGMQLMNYNQYHAHVDLSAVPTVPFLQQVQDYDYLYQDQTASRVDLPTFFNHRIGKLSCIKPRKK